MLGQYFQYKGAASFPALLLALLVPLTTLAPAHAEDMYILGVRDPQQDSSQNYLIDLMRAALDASKPRYGPYSLSTTTVAMQRRRLLRELETGELLNVNVQITSSDWEKTLIPIRIPVDKGLTNFRISLIDKSHQAEFSRIKSLSQLQQLTVGVGEQWATRDLYLQNGLHVVTGNSNTGMVGMLMEGRFDYLPRSVEEAVREEATLSPRYSGLAMERSIMLYLPAPRYFFVSPRSPHLAERLNAGLEILIANGEFDRAFLKYYGASIARAHLCKRTIFQLKNADLSAETPLKRKNLWFNPLVGPDKDVACRNTSGKP